MSVRVGIRYWTYLFSSPISLLDIFLSWASKIPKFLSCGPSWPRSGIIDSYFIRTLFGQSLLKRFSPGIRRISTSISGLISRPRRIRETITNSRQWWHSVKRKFMTVRYISVSTFENEFCNFPFEEVSETIFALVLRRDQAMYFVTVCVRNECVDEILRRLWKWNFIFVCGNTGMYRGIREGDVVRGRHSSALAGTPCLIGNPQIKKEAIAWSQHLATRSTGL